ncbi:MAG: PIN domain-containing protein [Candidatus Diapherotrites archaeon]
MARMYLDANVFISYFRGEIGANYRGLFVEAEKVLDFLHVNGHTVVISSLCLKEIETVSYIRKTELEDLFKRKNITTEFVTNPEYLDWKPFEKIGIHYPDALHVALAIYYQCEAIITFNVHDFLPAKKIRIIDPREL